MSKFDPKRMIEDMLKRVTKRMKKVEPIEKKLGRKTVSIIPMPYDILEDEFVRAFHDKTIAGIEAYHQAMQERDALLDEFLLEINHQKGSRLTRADNWKFSTADGLIAITNTKNSSPVITPQLVEARKKFIAFIQQYQFEKNKNTRPFVKMADKSFRAIDREISPKPEDIRDLANRLAEFDPVKMPEAKEIRALLLQGWEVKDDKREIRLTVRDEPTSNARVVSVRNYQPQPQEQ